MTVARAIFVLTLMVLVGVAMVLVRGETAKAANRVHDQHRRKLELERCVWSQDLALARLRGPEAIRHRAAELGLNVVPPSPRGP